ncbi:MAG: response regulator [Myxococcota bacterium]|nr:response regulator [Myxococcota bacterium]
MSHVPLILISDDEPLVVSALARLARRVGLSFISDTTSDHVLQLARERKPDLIILDVNQRTDGRDLLASLKKDPSTRDIKVLMLSAYEDQYIRHQCLELGAEDYVVKPFDAVFISKVARLCGLLLEASATSWTAPPSVDSHPQVAIRLGAE